MTGIIEQSKLKTNDGARPGDLLFLSKPLGIGVLTTAEKKKILREKDKGVATELMLRTNKLGLALAELDGVTAITDVTGFGLLGHLTELCEASHVAAEISYAKVPAIEGIAYYLAQGSYPGGTGRNFDSYGHKITAMSETQKLILCDPQTSGGLLVSVSPDVKDDFQAVCLEHDLDLEPFGEIKEPAEKLIKVI